MYGILLRIRQISGDALRIPRGSIYPALYRLEDGGFIKSQWGDSEGRQREQSPFEIQRADKGWKSQAEGGNGLLGAAGVGHR